MTDVSLSVTDACRRRRAKDENGDPQVQTVGGDLGSGPLQCGVDRDTLVMGLAAVFAGLTVTMTVLALSQSPFLFILVIAFGLVTYFMWYHASGRLEQRTRRRARRRPDAGDGADPDASEASRAASGGRSRFAEQARRARQRRRANGQRASDGGRRAAEDPRRTRTGMGRREAIETLDVEADASQETIKRAYRERVKEVHPDSGGDEETFKRVNRAYETLKE